VEFGGGGLEVFREMEGGCGIKNKYNIMSKKNMDKGATKEYWSMTEGVFNCLSDKKRTDAFKKAINNTVKRGDIVVDMGTGSGVLAMFAADAGAKKVYAVEFDENNIRTLRENFLINGYDKKIEVIAGDVTKVKLPEKVDVIIGEMIATALIEELQIQAMNNMLKYAKKSIKVLLNKFENYVDLVYNDDNYYGKKFKILRYEYPGEKKMKSISLSSKFLYSSVDFSKINTKNKVNKKINLFINKNGIINGVRLSSRTIFHDNSFFDFSFAYSYPIILPIKDLAVVKGDVFEVSISYEMCKGFKNFTYKLIKK